MPTGREVRTWEDDAIWISKSRVHLAYNIAIGSGRLVAVGGVDRKLFISLVEPLQPNGARRVGSDPCEFFTMIETRPGDKALCTFQGGEGGLKLRLRIGL